MKRAVCLLVFSCLVLAGCRTPLPPIQDASEDVPRARLRAIADKTSIIEGASKGESRRELVRRGGANGRSLGMPNPERAEKQSFNEFYVEAGKPFTLFFDSKVYDFYCYIRGSFVPVEGKNYEASVQLLYNEIRFGMGTDKICVIDVFVLSDDGQWKPVRVFR